MALSTEKTKIVTKVRVHPGSKNAFIDWQAKLNAQIVAFPGFLSLEILSPADEHSEWVIIQRFDHSTHLSTWIHSQERQELLEELKKNLADPHAETINETKAGIADERVVTEIFVTLVEPHNEKAYYDWIAKIHQIEARFPGFRGVYVQAPTKGQKRNWITLLQFDTPENLDHWLSSAARKELLLESKPLITSIENHRVVSSYAGWFASIAKDGVVPPVWKQTMLVLLVLFPIVMLEMKFLPFLLSQLNPSLATFIGNALSVTLIAWPMMPIAIWFLGWWLSPQGLKHQQNTMIGTLVVILLYIIEIDIFWNLL